MLRFQPLSKLPFPTCGLASAEPCQLRESVLAPATSLLVIVGSLKLNERFRIFYVFFHSEGRYQKGGSARNGLSETTEPKCHDNVKQMLTDKPLRTYLYYILLTKRRGLLLEGGPFLQCQYK